MNAQIYGMFPLHKEIRTIEIFGYSSNGIPGVEIIGLGKHGRTIKEKFLYLSRTLKLNITPRKYVLCVEDGPRSLLEDNNYRWLELPLLVLFWSLAKQLPVYNLDNCISSGKVSSAGKITPLSNDFLLKLKEDYSGMKFIIPDEYNLHPELHRISLESLLQKGSNRLLILNY